MNQSDCYQKSPNIQLITIRARTHKLNIDNWFHNRCKFTEKFNAQITFFFSRKKWTNLFPEWNHWRKEEKKHEWNEICKRRTHIKSKLSIVVRYYRWPVKAVQVAVNSTITYFLMTCHSLLKIRCSSFFSLIQSLFF